MSQRSFDVTRPKWQPNLFVRLATERKTRPKYRLCSDRSDGGEGLTKEREPQHPDRTPRTTMLAVVRNFWVATAWLWAPVLCALTDVWAPPLETLTAKWSMRAQA